jgi:predicted dehydrogenase
MEGTRVLRVGFVGAGGQATGAIYPSLRHAPIELIAVADLDRGLAERNARWFGAAEVYGSHEDLLKHADVEAVFVVGPPEMHYSIGLDILAAGKHLFVEKPPSDNVEQALELREVAHSNGLQLMVGFMKRFATAYARAAEIAGSQDFGDARLVRLDYAHWTVYNLHWHMTYAIHAIDLARHFLGDVVGGAATRREYPDGRVLIVELDHVGGAVSQLNISSCAPGVKESFDLYGSSQVVQVRDLTELRHYHDAPTYVDYNRDESMASLWHPEFTIPWRDTESLVLQGYAGEVEHFAERILAGQPVESNIDDAVAAMRILDSIEHLPEGRASIHFGAT